MTTLLCIRHGQSQANTLQCFAGALNSPLTELGQTQAAVTAEYITTHYSVDAVYASDLDRAFHTGQAVADRAHCPITPDRALREIAAGEWEGVAFDTLANRFAKSYDVWLHNIGEAVCDGGESVAHLQTRVVEAVTRIAREHDGQTVVIATHATPIRALQCYCEARPLSGMKDVPWVSNASVTTFTYQDGTLRVTEVNQHQHLGTLASKLPANV